MAFRARIVLDCASLLSNAAAADASEHPDGPRTAKALYEAVYRQCVLVDMFNGDQSDKKADAAKARAHDLAARLRDKFAQSDYTARATALVFKIDQGIPVYGIDQK